MSRTQSFSPGARGPAPQGFVSLIGAGPGCPDLVTVRGLKALQRADVILFDEPTSGLDPLGRMKVREISQRLKDEGKTVFFSSHELGEVETICDRVAIVNQGELKAAGRVSDLVAQHQASLEKAFLDIIGYQPLAVS